MKITYNKTYFPIHPLRFKFKKIFNTYSGGINSTSLKLYPRLFN